MSRWFVLSSLCTVKTAGQAKLLVCLVMSANATLRTKSFPAAASLVEEQLESLPSLVESLRTRLTRAQDSVVNRDATKKEPASSVELQISEELSFWTEQARIVASVGESPRSARSKEEVASSSPLGQIPSSVSSVVQF